MSSATSDRSAPVQALTLDQKRNNFDLIRMLLALAVIWSHSFPLGTGSEQSEPIALLTRRQATGGSIAVDLFFVISGFLITASAERSSTIWDYLRKRVARIYPGFLVALLFGLALALTVASARLPEASIPGRIGAFLLRAIQLKEFPYSGAFPENPAPGAINGSLWSIPYEFWCYIGVAGLSLLGWLRWPRRVLVLFGASIVVRVLFAVFQWHPGVGFLGRVFGEPELWARLLPLYLAGVVAYQYRSRIPVSPAVAVAALAVLAAAAVLPHGWSAGWPLAGSYLLFFAAYQPWLRAHGFARHGDFSYGVYLYAFPVEQLVMHRAGHPLAPWLLFTIAAPVTVILAMISWFVVEKPFLVRARARSAQLRSQTGSSVAA